MARERGGTQETAPAGRREGREYDPETLVPQKRGSHRVMAGSFVLAGLLAIVLALFTLTDPGTFRGRYDLVTTVDNAGGIRRGDPVQLRGVNIGRVKSFSIEPTGVAVTLELEREYKVPADSHMLLQSSGLMGGMTATILPGRAANMLADGDTIPGAREVGALDNVAGLGQRADTVLARAQAMLSNANVANVSESTTQLRALLSSTSAMIAEDRANIRALTLSLRNTTAELEGAHPGRSIAATMARLDSLTAQLGAASGRLNAASLSLQVVLGRVEKGEGTLGKLSADPTLYNNLNAAAANLNQLAEDIRTNPKRYINIKVF